MTLEFGVALLLLGASPVAMRARLGREWLYRPFALLVICACVYHGLSESVIRLSGVDQGLPYRPPREWADTGALMAGAGLLVMTLGYLASHPPTSTATTYDREHLAKVLDWRILAALTAPLLVATMSGEGYVGAEVQGGPVSAAGLAIQFLVPLLVVTSLGYLLRHPHHFALVLVAQSIVMALAGQRLEVFIVGVCLWLLARRVGIAPSRREIAALGVVAILLATAISSARSAGERELFYEDNGFGARAQALTQGLLSPSYRGVASDNPVTDAAVRLDSNAWAGRVAEGLDDRDPVGAEVVYDSALSLVPSVLFPDKVERLTLARRSFEISQTQALGLPQIDYLPGHVTTFLGALGFPTMLLFNLAFGALLGLVEAWALRRADAVGLATVLLLVQSALFFERGLPYYLLAGRALLVVAPALWIWGLIPRGAR